MRRDPVQSVTLLLTRDCNLSCRYCRRDRRRRAAMPATVLQRALEVALDLAGDELTVELSGGEPLLAPARLGEALARLAEVRRDGPRVERRLQTNGLGLDDAMLATLVAHDVALDVSCDGPRGQAQRGPGTFAALDRTLRRIRRRHPDYWRRRVAVAVVVAPATLRYLGETVAYFLALGVPRIALAPACGAQARWGRALCAELARQLADVYDQAVAHRRCTGAVPLRYLSADPALEPGGETAAVCGAGLRRSFVVDVDGSVHGCAQLARAAGRRLPVAVARLAAALAFGNVADPDFAPRWRRAGAPADRLPVLRSRVGHATGTDAHPAGPRRRARLRRGRLQRQQHGADPGHHGSAAEETNSPVIVQASRGARNYSNDNYLRHLMLAAAELNPELIPIAMHQDHGNSPATCYSAIEQGFTSVMMDGSLQEDGKTPASYEYNVEVTRKVVEVAHALGVTVEGELGCLGGIEDGHGAGLSGDEALAHLTDPDQAGDFVADRLRRARRGHRHQPRRLQVQEEAHRRRAEDGRHREDPPRLPNCHLVMHGSSSVPQGAAGHHQQVRRRDEARPTACRSRRSSAASSTACARSTWTPTTAWPSPAPSARSSREARQVRPARLPQAGARGDGRGRRGPHDRLRTGGLGRQDQVHQPGRHGCALRVGRRCSAICART
jgi:fructose/tagatose bisphosphate aldolase/sulfatase maturation enzyme AslB (radical SAM superfamily)